MGAIIKYTNPETGQEQEFEVRPINSVPLDATHFVTKGGEIKLWDAGQKWGLGVHVRDEPGIYLRLVRKRHTFGPNDGPKVVFEETGEKRIPLVDEWALAGTRPFLTVPGPSGPHTILRPVAIEDQP